MMIKIEELLEVLSVWPLSEQQQEEIREILMREPPRESAWLFRYDSRRGSKVAQLEQAFAEACGARYAVAVNSGTSALIASLTALGIGPGDDVLIPAYTFIASASAVLVAGAIPNLVEVDETLTMDVEDLARKITPRSRAILPVHMNGRPAAMARIAAVAHRHGLHIVEDAAQACGGTCGGRWLGTLGDAGCFSFGQYKIVNAGEGGMVVTDDARLAMRIRSYHDTAANWRPDRFAPERVPGELFPGENYRMSELHGAVALAQLKKLPRYLARCRTFRAALLADLRPEVIDPFVVAPDYDTAGDVAEWLVLTAPTPDVGALLRQRLAESGLKTGGLRERGFRDWHVYRFWEHILRQSTANRVGHPYASYPMASLSYSADACPRTLDVLERTVMVHIPALAVRNAARAVYEVICDAARAARQLAGS